MDNLLLFSAVPAEFRGHAECMIMHCVIDTPFMHEVVEKGDFHGLILECMYAYVFCGALMSFMSAMN